MSLDTKPIGRRLLFLPALFAAELLLIVLVFQVLSDFECQKTTLETACRGLRSVMVRAYCLTAAMFLFLWVRPDLRKLLINSVQAARGDWTWALLHFAGTALVFVPWILASPGQLSTSFPMYFLTLSIGGSLALVGGLFWLMPPRDWAAFLKAGQSALLVVSVVAVLVPDFATVLSVAWTLDALVISTFYGVAILLTLLGNPVSVGFAPPSIGSKGFIVEIAASCSGVEGFALATGFLAIYAALMRDTINPRRLWLVVWPLALLASWTLNIVRITTLILIGANGSPDLAVNGFHSFAGWLFFTVLAIGVIGVAQSVPWLHRTRPAPGADVTHPPLREDPTIGYIVPFIMFMVTGLMLNAFWSHPELGYPFQMIVLVGLIWYFRRVIFREWAGFDPVAILAGLAIGAGWIALAEPSADALPGLSTLGVAATATWVMFRVIGTTLIIPVVEEAFFRGYILTRLDVGGTIARVGAVAVSSLAFALLHGRIIEAGIAGLIFSLVMLRRGKLSDAILCHATANGLIAVAALVTQDWSLI